VAVQLLKDGVAIANTTTDASGHYSFAEVAPGTYSVRFTAPADTSFSTFPSGQTPLFNVSSGQAYSDADTGLYQGALRPPLQDCLTCLT
jgi:protocatechuate 3,4-dioxygenase beta subunit